MTLHSLLRRQLRRHAVEPESLPDGLRALLDAVSQAYRESDDDRLMVERSLEISSQELFNSNAEIRQSEERFRRLAENSPVGIYQLSAEHHPVYMNPALLSLIGADDISEVAQRPFESLFSADSLETLRRHHAMRVEGEASTYEGELIGLNGTKRSVLVSGAPVYDSNLGPLSSLGTVIDVTDRKQAERDLRASEKRFRSLVQHISDLIMVVDSNSNFLYASPSMAHVLGDGAMSLRGGKLSSLLHPEDAAGVLGFLNGAWHVRAESNSFEARLRHNDGSWRVFEFVGTDQRLDPAVSGFVLNARDVTERRELEEQLRHQAFHDPLTGLANRARLGDRLEHALERARRQELNVALIFMDVDNFKSVNDGWGHSVGDIALQYVAKQLQACLRPGDTAARVGGDEFAILLEDSTIDDAVRMSDEILNMLATPMSVDDEEVVMRVSIGIAGSEVSAYDADGLLRNADIAMYAAKDAGKARHEVYRPSMRVALLERLALLRDMERAIERGEFFVEYQPLVDLSTAVIVGFEALVRWEHPKLGVLPPLDFIGVAEESGMIVSLGQQVLERACRQAKQWQDEFPSEPRRTMHVNVSVKQLQQKEFVRSLLDILSETRLDPGSLTLEVTESVMLENSQSTSELLEVIRSHGVRIAIDDFGTGYSSLSYLSRFPFDVLKIDKAFVDQSLDSERDGVLARAIIDLGRTFAVEVVAEGIEDQAELERLREFNCRTGQGFLFAEPGSAEHMTEMLRQVSARAKAA